MTVHHFYEAVTFLHSCHSWPVPRTPTPPEPLRAVLDVDLSALTTLAADVARRCGALVRDERPTRLGVHATKSSDTNVVTVMDHRSEALARDLLRGARPLDGILGEEGSRTVGDSGLTWLVDPIDGTVNYLYGRPDYSVSVAAVVGDPTIEGGWYPVLGAVYQPCLDQLFVAHRGGGAHRVVSGISQELHLTDAPELEAALVGTGFSYIPEVRAEQGALIARLLPLVRDIRRAGSAALDLCAVASGELDLYFERGLNPWDMAAAWVVVEEAGGTLLGPGGGLPRPHLTIAGADPALSHLRNLVDVP